MAARARLLKVVVQAYLVWDDGENLTEHVMDPVTVSPAEWPGFPDVLDEALREMKEPADG